MMGEGYVKNFVRSTQVRLVFWLTFSGLLLVGLHWVLANFADINSLISTLVLAIAWLIIAFVMGLSLGNSITKPTRYISQAILHISPSEHLVSAPNVEELGLGRELVSTLTRQIYDYTAIAQSGNTASDSIPATLFDQLPIAVIGIDEKNHIVLANSKAKTVTKDENFLDQELKNVLNFSSEEEGAIEAWIEEARAKSLTEFKTWPKVEVRTLNNESLGYFDIAVSFNKHSASGVEAVLTFADHSDVYDAEDASISFIALAVHELRNPVSILRGYVEAFEEELGPDASPQLKDDLKKMNASAENMATFVSNILNVAKINQGQLMLKLHEDNWNTVLPQVVDNLRNRASVYGKTIELRMQPDMPPVAVDRMTIGEVVTNLIDNAIKYSPSNAPDITIVSKVNSEGRIETTVTDKGVGIPSSVMPHLFSKFRRNHRNQGQIGGTGLGLFLSKAIITAHNGNIYASSKEGQGSTFGFTLIPYSQLDKDQQVNNNGEMVRSSHGWIKNHSMQRR